MPNYCVICKKITSKVCGKSIHRMPSDKARRKLWIDQLNFKNSKSAKGAYICSDHFCDEDFLYKSGKRFLKTEAVPSRISLSLHCSTSSDERTATKELSDNINNINLGNVEESSKLNGDNISRTLSDSDSSATLTASDSSATLTASDSSATLTASESSATMTASESSSKLEVFAVAHPISSEAKRTVQRARRRKFYVGDVTDEDFRTPEQGKFVFSLAKQKIAEQKKALRALRMKNRRLRQKISDLSGLLNSLREMNHI